MLVCTSVCLYVSVDPVCVYVYQCMSTYYCGGLCDPVYVCVCLCVSVCACVCLCLCVSLCMSV